MVGQIVPAALAAMLVLLPGETLAQALPALFEAVAGDVKVRAASEDASEVVATIKADRTGVEGVAFSVDREWVLVAPAAHRAGWARRADLAVVPPPPNLETDFDRPLWCFGNEPFWSLTSGPATGAIWEGWQGETVSLSRRWAGGAINRSLYDQTMVAEADGLTLTTTIRPDQCDDGMGGGPFGFHALVLVKTADGYALVSGCCSLSPQGG